ncbi:AAA family ATPase [Mycobacteroides abscessus]|uniref:AAA family ATPase n=1 Tax=Mycobacteroides abscessus TaxID=36809 RepID=UPI0013F5D447|nr:AAA family ATPase [Mycobacteroides abscessus]
MEIPAGALVLLIGVSGSGKSSFAAQHFTPTQVLSSDHFRAMISDVETDQSCSRAAFEAMEFVAAKRLELGRTTVIDATNVESIHRAPFLALARYHNAPMLAIVLQLPLDLCVARAGRRSRAVAAQVIAEQAKMLEEAMESLHHEGFTAISILSGAQEIAAVNISAG